MTDYSSDITPMSSLTLSEAMELIETLRLDIHNKSNLLEAQKSAMSAANHFLAKTIEDAKMHLEAYIDDNDIEIEEGTDFEALCNLLEVERTKNIEITVTMTWNITATIPRNYDAQEWANEQDWSAEFDETIADFEYVSSAEIEVEAF